MLDPLVGPRGREWADRQGASRTSPGVSGFVAYTFASLGDGTNCSISVWTSAEAAAGAMAAAGIWTAANIAVLGYVVEDRTGRLGFVVGKLAAVPA